MASAAFDPAADGSFELTRSTATVGPIDIRTLMSWLGGGARRAGVVAWPVVLFPDFLAGRGTMPADSIELYQRVEWRTPVPAGEFSAVVRPAWVGRRESRSEYELVSEAVVGSEVVASSRIVCLTKYDVEASGRPDLPEPPDPEPLYQVRPITVSDDDVSEFCAATGTNYLVTSRIGVAQELGYRNVLVPGPLLTAVHLAAWDGAPDAGSVEIWFRGPVTSGSAMAMCRSAADAALSSLRPVGGNRPATVCRTRSAG